MPTVSVGRHFVAILVVEWQGVIEWSCNSKIPLVFAHVVLTKTLGVCRSREIRALIHMQMELLKSGLHAGLVGDANAEGAVREGRSAPRKEEEEEAVSQIYHDTVLSGKLRQAVRRATNREGG